MQRLRQQGWFSGTICKYLSHYFLSVFCIYSSLRNKSGQLSVAQMKMAILIQISIPENACFSDWFLKVIATSASGKVPIWQCRRYKRHRFEPWIGMIPWNRKWQLQYSCLEHSRQKNMAGYSPWGYKESDLTEHAQNPKMDFLESGENG